MREKASASVTCACQVTRNPVRVCAGLIDLEGPMRSCMFPGEKVHFLPLSWLPTFAFGAGSPFPFVLFLSL